MACDYVRCPPGEIVTGLHRGDVLLIRGPGWLGRLIRLGAGRRLSNDGRRYAYWSHAAIVLSDEGHLLEVHAASASAASKNSATTTFFYVRLRLSELARYQAVRYAYDFIGQRYDLVGFLLLGLSVTMGHRLRVPDTGKPGCVSLIVRALERAGMAFDRPPPEMMPADLAKKFSVLP